MHVTQLPPPVNKNTDFARIFYMANMGPLVNGSREAGLTVIGMIKWKTRGQHGEVCGSRTTLQEQRH